MAREAGHRRASRGRSPRSRSSTTTATELAGRTRSAPSTCPCGTGNFEYHKDKEKTEKNRIGKFFTVGDVGYLDEDGYLFLRDRKIDMIISGGVNIYPAEIESVLLTHPKVGDAAVFGIPHDDWGEEVKAVVEPAEGVEPAPELAAEILGCCAEHGWPSSRRRRSIDFTDEMPRDPNGKLYKRKLRDPYWEGPRARPSDPRYR